MTGRIVDSYTNIATVKLFSHSKREESYAREGLENFLQTVHGQMRLVTSFHFSLYAMNCLLLFSVGAHCHLAVDRVGDLRRRRSCGYWTCASP